MSGLWNFRLSRKAMAPFFPRVFSRSSRCPWEKELFLSHQVCKAHLAGFSTREVRGGDSLIYLGIRR
jgi:hypothetical protein